MSKTLGEIEQTGGCRFPVTGDRPFYFCGAERASTLAPYCAEHMSLCYQQGTRQTPLATAKLPLWAR